MVAGSLPRARDSPPHPQRWPHHPRRLPLLLDTPVLLTGTGQLLRADV